MKNTNILYISQSHSSSFQWSYIKQIKEEIIENKKDSIIHSIIIGLVLGDGSLYKNYLDSNARLELSFGEKYKNFALSIENIFKDFISNPLKEVKIKGKNKIYINYRLKTKSLPLFTQYYTLFYKFDTEKSKIIKIIPTNIIELLNPIVLAYLIMSDGNFDKNRNRVRIYTNSFKKEEVQLLADAINKNFGIYVGVLHDRKDQWILTIGAKQLDLLRQTVSQHFDPSMLYRIGL